MSLSLSFKTALSLKLATPGSVCTDIYTCVGDCLYLGFIITKGSVCTEIVYIKNLILQQQPPSDVPLYPSCTRNLALVIAGYPKKGCSLISTLLSVGASSKNCMSTLISAIHQTIFYIYILYRILLYCKYGPTTCTVLCY